MVAVVVSGWAGNWNAIPVPGHTRRMNNQSVYSGASLDILTVINPSKQEAKVSNIVAYYRVSTQKQEKSGLGLEGQRVAVAAFAAAEGLTIVAEYTETETGKGSDALDRRPQLKAAMKAAKQHKASVCVARLDRLSRDVHFISGLMAH